MYNIKAAAKLLDMPKVTIRSWETRYNAITPARTESGHRLYSEQNLEDLKWLKIQVQENGLKISEAVKQLHVSRKKFTAKTDDRMPDYSVAQQYDKQIEQLYTAAAEMDSERLQYLMDLNFSLFHHRDVFFLIIAPLMVRIGNEWENGSLSVAHEHMVSNIVQQRFNQFFRIFPTSGNLPKVMALCPSGERHQLGLLLFTLFLRENGYPVTYIGADTPLEGLAELAVRQDFKLACLSIADPQLLAITKEYIAELAKAKPDMEFAVGGSGADGFRSDDNGHFLGSSYETWKGWLEKQR